MAEAARTYSPEKCDRLFTRLKANGNWQAPTLTVARSFSLLTDPQFRQDSRLNYFGGEYRDWLTATAKGDTRLKSWTTADFAIQRELFQFDEKMVGAMFRSGVPLLSGMDAGNPYCFPGFSLHDELALLVESGLTPLAALQSATSNAAVFMNATDSYGSIAPGKIADLVLLDADPLQDIHNTSKIRAVFLAGKEFDRAALDSILRGAEAAANHATNTAEESQKSEEAQGLKMPGSSAGATDSSNGSAETELRAFMAELRKASIEGDVDTIANSMTDDYVQTDINGYRQDKATWLNEYFKPLANLIKAGKFHWDEYERKNLQFRFYGDCAVVTGELELKGTGAKFGPQHTWVAEPNATFSGTLHFTHIYIKQNRKWLLAALHNQLAAQPQQSNK